MLFFTKNLALNTLTVSPFVFRERKIIIQVFKCMYCIKYMQVDHKPIRIYIQGSVCAGVVCESNINPNCDKCVSMLWDLLETAMFCHQNPGLKLDTWIKMPICSVSRNVLLF